MVPKTRNAILQVIVNKGNNNKKILYKSISILEFVQQFFILILEKVYNLTFVIIEKVYLYCINI